MLKEERLDSPIIDGTQAQAHAYMYTCSFVFSFIENSMLCHMVVFSDAVEMAGSLKNDIIIYPFYLQTHGCIINFFPLRYTRKINRDGI